MNIQAIHHLQLVVTEAREAATRDFYTKVLGLPEIPKPENLKKNGGFWLQCGLNEIHFAVESSADETNVSKRHPCFLVTDLDACLAEMRSADCDIQLDQQPIPGCHRFYARDPAGNRIEFLSPVHEERLSRKPGPELRNILEP